MITWLRDTEAHFDGSGVAQNIYSYISLGTPVARVNRTGNTSASLEYDFQGLASNTLAAVDATGAVNASLSYAPFGELLETTDAGGVTAGVATHRRRLNDKFVDAVSDLSYYGARYYDRTLIGWTQCDPLYRFVPDARWGAPRRGNLFSFALNNSLRYLDPDGRDVWTRGAEHWSKGGVVGQGGVRAAWDKETRGYAYGGADSLSASLLERGLAGQDVTPTVCVGPPGQCEQAVESGPSFAWFVHENGGRFADWTNPGGVFDGLRWDSSKGKIVAVPPSTGGKVVGWAILGLGAGALAYGIGAAVVGALGSETIASTAPVSVPLLAGGPAKDMMGQVYEVLANTPIAQRPAMAADLLAQVAARTTTAEWAFTQVNPSQGAAAAWIGNVYGMVITSTGQVLTGTVTSANLSFGANGVTLSDWSKFAEKVSGQ